MSHHLLSQSGAVLGCDVGWSEKRKSSAACYLAFDRDGASIQIAPRFTAKRTDLEKSLAALVGRRPLLAAAFDGPFRRDLNQIGVYRACERVLTVGLAPLIGKPGQSSSPNGRKLNVAANAFVKTALAMGCIAEADHLAAIHPSAVAEAFPTSFLGTMLEDGFHKPRRTRSDSYFERLTTDPRGDRLAGLVMSLLGGRPLRRRLQDVLNHDDQAAIVCAITALCIAARRYTAIGDDNGYIILPPPVVAGECGLQPWAMKVIRTNVATANAHLIVEDEQEAR
jgi:hypothetical protein